MFMATIARPHLLIVDDDASVREALATALRPSYTVSLAATGAEALACVEQREIDGVILDVRLGDEDGLALLPSLRRRTGVRVLVLTGHGDKATVRRAFLAGAHDCLDKPLAVPTLLQVVAAMVGRPVTDPVLRVKAFIEAHFKETLPLAALARVAQMSERHLQRQFAERFGCSPIEYLTWVRVQAAQRLRREQRLPLRAIAPMVGFSDPTYLARVLRKLRRGEWPTEPSRDLPGTREPSVS
jgi:YesN/AraC family two-component response regulator